MELIARLSSVVLPMVILLAAAAALCRKTDVFSAFTAGARDGLSTVLQLIPTLCGLLCAVHMLRASGLFDALAALAAPLLSAVGIPSELAMLMLVRPFSGSGALAAGAELITAAGADSLAGRMAAVMLASSETTLYTVSVYFGAAGVRRSGKVLAAAFAAELTAFFVAAAAVQLLW